MPAQGVAWHCPRSSPEGDTRLAEPVPMHEPTASHVAKATTDLVSLPFRIRGGVVESRQNLCDHLLCISHAYHSPWVYLSVQIHERAIMILHLLTAKITGFTTKTLIIQIV